MVQCVLGRCRPVEARIRPIGPGEPHQAHGVVWIELERAPEQHPRLGVVVLGEMTEQLEAPHQAFPSLEALGAAVPDAGLLALDELELERSNHVRGDLVLEREDVAKLAVEAHRPKLRAADRLDELGGDAHPAAGFAHAPLEHVAYVQLAADDMRVDGLALVGEGRVARNHEQV